jgi:hypothetical protein
VKTVVLILDNEKFALPTKSRIMNSQDKENVIIYRIKEKGLEVFLVNKDGQNKDNWELPCADGGEGKTITAVMHEDRLIELERVEEAEGGLFEQAYAVEADWHDIPSIKSIIKNDVKYVKNTVKQMIPDVMENGTFFAVKEAFRRVLPHQYKQLKELKDVLIDRNNTTF